MNYRKLSADEIKQLEQQGCLSDNWEQVEVASVFSCSCLHYVKFTGHNRLGVFEKKLAINDELSVQSGIFNAWLHNCTIGDNVFIRNVGQYISNYTIENEVVIQDVGVVETVGTSSFGNGEWMNVISESGTHRIPIYNELSAQLAYLLVSFREKTTLVSTLEKMIVSYSDKIKSTKGTIKTGAVISGCRTIRNVFVGENAHLENAMNLTNGSICSSFEAPVYVGNGCSCANFIIQSGTSLNNGVLLSNCFVGQGGLFDKQFSAEHSAFFANCQGFYSEVCSVFAGPYTVTHHKSSLLIAGMFSFANVGSGSNQSNHAYRTGPIHYGITERGIKLGSDSYLFLPARIGAFTLVSGRHYNHPDTSDFPFSYLIERNEKTQLIPGINFATIGTWRDVQKWKERDGRKGEKIDKIHFDLLNPFLVEKMQRAKTALGNSKTIFGKAFVDESSKRRGIEHYDFAEDLFLLENFVKKIEKNKKELQPNTSDGCGNWLDIAGMFAPAVVLEKLLQAIENGEITMLDKIEQTFETIFNAYSDYAWAWTADAFTKKYGKQPWSLSQEEIENYISRYKELAQAYQQKLQLDAKKDVIN